VETDFVQLMVTVKSLSNCVIVFYIFLSAASFWTTFTLKICQGIHYDFCLVFPKAAEGHL